MKNWIRKYKIWVVFFVFVLAMLVGEHILTDREIDRVEKMVGAHFEIARNGKIERVRILEIIRHSKHGDIEPSEPSERYKDIRYFVVEFPDGVVVLSRLEFNDFYNQGEKIKKWISETEKRKKILADIKEEQKKQDMKAP